MLKSKIFYIVLLVVLVALAIFYKKYKVSGVKNEAFYFMQATTSQPSTPNSNTKNLVATPKKMFGALLITSGVPNSQDMANGILCLENSANMEKIDLFMPDMGHGSEPPKVSPTSLPEELSKYAQTAPNFGCFSVESMQLFMPGTWQVRAFYKDGIIGIFTLNLTK